VAEFEIILNTDSVKASLAGTIEGYKDRVKPGARTAGRIIQADAKRRAPYKTGTLRRSIKSRVIEQGDEVVVQVGTNVHYAIHVEYGHRTRAGTGKKASQLINKKGKPVVRYVPGVFFLHNAFTAKRQAATGAIVAALQKGE